MIQRIQSLFLLLAAGIAVAFLFIPIGTIVDTTTANVLYEYNAFTLHEASSGESIYSTAYIALLWIAFALLSIVTIFCYKNRPRQIILANVNMLVLLAAMAAMLYVYPSITFEQNQWVTDRYVVEFNKWILLSILPAITLILAKRAIAKDERLVRAADRLR